MSQEKMKPSHKLTIAFLLGLTIFSSCDPSPKSSETSIPKIPNFEKLIFVSGNDTLRYRLLSPYAVEEGKKYPVVVFFHGAGQRGNDNEHQLDDFPDLLKNQSGRKKYPCYILVPQCPASQQWVNVNWHDSTEIFPAEISTSENLSMQLLSDYEKKFPIDTSRIYITGLSMGGYAVWDLICRYPEKFAAAVPVCGGGDEHEAEKIIRIPIWAFHGEKDDMVFPYRSENMVTAVNAQGGNAKITLYPGVGHASWNNAYADDKLFEWMFALRKK